MTTMLSAAEAFFGGWIMGLALLGVLWYGSGALGVWAWERWQARRRKMRDSL